MGATGLTRRGLNGYSKTLESQRKRFFPSLFWYKWISFMQVALIAIAGEFRKGKSPPQLLHTLSSTPQGRSQRRLAWPIRSTCQRIYLEARYRKAHTWRATLVRAFLCLGRQRRRNCCASGGHAGHFRPAIKYQRECLDFLIRHTHFIHAGEIFSQMGYGILFDKVQ